MKFYHLQWGQRRKRLNHIATTYPEVEKDVNFIAGMVLLKMAVAFPIWVTLLPVVAILSLVANLLSILVDLIARIGAPLEEKFLFFFYRGFNTPFDKKIEAANERIERALHGKE